MVVIGCGAEGSVETTVGANDGVYPRLALLRQFLRDDGAIFISIDDYEYENLKILMTEIFGAEHHVATFIWKRRTTPDSRNLNGVSGDHEYVLCYQRAGNFRVRG